MKKIVVYFVLFILCSCTEKINRHDLQKLNGIWEIEKVENNNGVVKEYKINESVEQIQFEDNKGTRRKVRLAYNGNFLLNTIIQEFSVEEVDQSFIIVNKTEFSNWKEEIKWLSHEKLVLENEQEMKYYYKKRKDIKIGKDGEEI